MTRRSLLVAGGAIAFLFATRSWYLPSGAPAWLRGTSPFSATETRAERKRCETFASMIGSAHPKTHYADENPNAVPEVQIQHTLRAGDSLAFDGQVVRGSRVNYVFHCATANVGGHPGEHHSAMSEPWGSATEWPAVNAIEERIARACADSAVQYYPTSRISPRTLMLRPYAGRGLLLAKAIDTTFDSPPETVSCWASVDANGIPDGIQVADPNARQ